MMVSTKGRYALRVMIDLAEHDQAKYIPLKEIANRQNISEKYLESILAVLSRANLVQALRGKGGGYRLNRPATDYTVGAILKLTEGNLAPVTCTSQGCSRPTCCKAMPMWERLEKMIDDFFEGITIADLIQEGGQI